MPLLSSIAQKKKIKFFLNGVPKSAQILEVGASDGWVKKSLDLLGYKNYLGLDILPPADIVGDIKDWNKLGLKASSFDIIIAFEVLEHVEFLDEANSLLKDGGLFMLTSPLPSMDWFCKLLENIGLNQKRTSAHNNLTNFRAIKNFNVVRIAIIGFCAQWGIFQKK